LFFELQDKATNHYKNKVSPIHEIDIYASQYHGYTKIDETKRVCLFPDAIRKFLRNRKQKVMLIRGESGSGKTILMHNIEYCQWQRYNRGKSLFLPILVNLAALDKTS